MTSSGWPRSRMARVFGIAMPSAIALAIVAILVIGAGSAAGSAQSRARPGKVDWHGLGVRLPLAHANARPNMKLLRAKAFRLDRGGLARLLRTAPAFTKRPSAQKSIVVSLPDPRGAFQRFAIHRSNLMAPGLAARHPDITTYSGVGVDDP